MYQSEATCQPVDCFKYKLALYKSSSACWSLYNVILRKGICSRHNKAEKDCSFCPKYNYNHSLYTRKMTYLQVEAIVGNSRLITLRLLCSHCGKYESVHVISRGFQTMCRSINKKKKMSQNSMKTFLKIL